MAPTDDSGFARYEDDAVRNTPLVRVHNLRDAVGRLPPQAVDVEKAILGAMLTDKEAIAAAIEALPRDAFYAHQHAKVYDAICHLFEKGIEVDTITVQEELRNRKHLDGIGGVYYLNELTTSVASSANVEYHARIVAEKALLRNLISTLTRAITTAYEPGTEAFTLLDETEGEIFGISESILRRRASKLGEVLKQTLDQLQTLWNRSEDVTGVPSGFTDLDKLTGGWQKSDLVIIAARPSMGKCVEANTPLLLADGRVERIADICARGASKLLTLGDGGRFELTQPAAYIDDGWKPVFQVRTALGRTVTTTITHPFLTPRGWQPLSVLRRGEAIAVPRELGVFGRHEVPEERLASLACTLRRPSTALRPLPGRGTRVAAVPITTLPDWAFTLSRTSTARLIEHLLHGSQRLEVSNRRLAQQLAHILLRFGILARVSYRAGAWLVTVLDSMWQRRVRGSVESGGSQIVFDKIVSIESRGMRPVFDLTIEDTHNFVASDVCVHNTALALACARNAAMYPENSTPCAVFSLEMTAQQLAQRLITSEARVNAQVARGGKMSNAELTRLMNAASRLEAAPIYIDDTPALSVLELRAKSRRLKAEHDIGLVVVDYLQLMHGSNPNHREQEIAHISRSLKALAKELNVPVVALSQLNREPEKRADKRPILADLRESGSIEQDADLVAFIFRPERYGISTFANGQSTAGAAEIIIAKHRNGPTGSVKLAFTDQFAKFENLDTMHESSQTEAQF